MSIILGGDIIELYELTVHEYDAVFHLMMRCIM